MSTIEAEFDPITSVVSREPAGHYATVAAERALLWHPERHLWIAAHPDIVREVLDNEDCRVRPIDQSIPAHLAGTPAGAAFGRFARMRDGDDHLPSRRAIVRALAALDPEAVRSTTVRLAADMPTGDLDRYVFELPVRVMGSVLGVPDDELADLASWTTALVGCVHASASQTEIDAGVEAAVNLDRLFRRLLQSHEPPPVLVAMEEAFHVEGLQTDHAIANAIGLLFQTHDATAGLVGNAIVHRIRQPEAGDDPIDAVVERVARQDPSVHNTRRFVARDTVIAGQRVEAGDTILVVLAAAGAVEPDRVWTFGHGAHACPGKSIALTIASAAVGSLMGRQAPPIDLPSPMRYCPLANVRIPVFSPASEEVPR